MNVLDENIPEGQRRLLLQQRVRVRQIGLDLGQKGMKDSEVIPLLHTLDRPTLFTFDADFFQRRLCHPNYCLVWLDVQEDQAAYFIRRTLRHRALNARAKRLGTVIQVSPAGLLLWRLRENSLLRKPWTNPKRRRR